MDCEGGCAFVKAVARGRAGPFACAGGGLPRPTLPSPPPIAHAPIVEVVMDGMVIGCVFVREGMGEGGVWEGRQWGRGR